MVCDSIARVTGIVDRGGGGGHEQAGNTTTGRISIILRQSKTVLQNDSVRFDRLTSRTTVVHCQFSFNPSLPAFFCFVLLLVRVCGESSIIELYHRALYYFDALSNSLSIVVAVWGASPRLEKAKPDPNG